jgi:hypothetical protein
MRQTSAIKRTTTKSSKPKNRLETPLAQTSYPQEDHYKKVQEIAYQLYVARGCAHGFDVVDWVAAEQIVKGS